MESITALVPMRANSERVKHKNRRLFRGKPLFWHVARQLQDCERIDRVVIDTDSEEIAETARRTFDKVHIIPRPPHLVDGRIPMNTIIDYDLSQLDGDLFLQTHSTNPLLQGGTIDRAIHAFLQGRKCFDSLFSVTAHQKRFFWENGDPVNHELGQLLRTQDMDPLYQQNGNIYIFSRESFLRTGNRIGSSPQMFEMSGIEALDIDTEEDFRIAELLWDYVYGNDVRERLQ